MKTEKKREGERKERTMKTEKKREGERKERAMKTEKKREEGERYMYVLSSDCSLMTA